MSNLEGLEGVQLVRRISVEGELARCGFGAPGTEYEEWQLDDETGSITFNLDGLNRLRNLVDDGRRFANIPPDVMEAVWDAERTARSQS